MPGGTACGLLLLYEGLAVYIVMDTFDRLPTVLALGTVPLVVTLLATYKALVVVVPTILLGSYTSDLGTLA